MSQPSMLYAVRQFTFCSGGEGAPTTKPVTLHLVSRASGKPAIASVANSLLHSAARRVVGKPELAHREPFELSVEDLQCSLEGETHHAVKAPQTDGGESFIKESTALLHRIS